MALGFSRETSPLVFLSFLLFLFFFFPCTLLSSFLLIFSKFCQPFRFLTKSTFWVILRNRKFVFTSTHVPAPRSWWLPWQPLFGSLPGVWVCFTALSLSTMNLGSPHSLFYSFFYSPAPSDTHTVVHLVVLWELSCASNLLTLALRLNRICYAALKILL